MDTIDSSKKKELTKVLEVVIEELHLKNFCINFAPHKGDGFLGEIYKVSIFEQPTNRNIHLVIKKAPSEEDARKETIIPQAYRNEIHFYTKMIPNLKKFREDHNVSEHFAYIPTCVANIPELGKETIVFEDITSLGFQMREKKFILDKEHAEVLFENYGKFHAVSFCFKDQKPEVYNDLVKNFYNVFEYFSKKESFCNGIREIVQKTLDALDKKEDGALIEKLRKYATNTEEMFSNIISYQGQYSGILHGDCWSNNIMFKYKNFENRSQLEDISLFDFQMVYVGTPVYDLSYFFYSGGSKELFSNLNDYLDLYHQSFSRYATLLRSNPEVLFPREILTQEWKIYCKFGMLMSMIIIKMKLMKQDDSIEIAAHGQDRMKQFKKTAVDEQVLYQRIKDILVHMDDIDAL